MVLVICSWGEPDLGGGGVRGKGCRGDLGFGMLLMLGFVKGVGVVRRREGGDEDRLGGWI